MTSLQGDRTDTCLLATKGVRLAQHSTFTRAHAHWEVGHRLTSAYYSENNVWFPETHFVLVSHICGTTTSESPTPSRTAPEKVCPLQGTPLPPCSCYIGIQRCKVCVGTESFTVQSIVCEGWPVWGFLLLDCRSPWYILDMNPLSDTQFTNVFPNSIGCLFPTGINLTKEVK